MHFTTMKVRCLYKKRYKYAQDYFKGEYDDEKIYYDRLGFTGNNRSKCL